MAYDQQELFEQPSPHSIDCKISLEASRIVEIGDKSLTTTPVFEAYWRFAEKRQQIFFKRVVGANEPDLSDDPILSVYRFTNAYRASDRVSQYLLRKVIWNDDRDWSDRDYFYRTLLFKLFNRIDTWESLENEFGVLSWREYDFDALDRLLNIRQASGKRNYSAAYIMPSAGSVFGHKSKHANHLRLLEWMINERYPERLKACRNMGEAYDLMLAAPSIGPFLAYQFVTDLNYGPLTSFSEMEFVKAGPGALDGVSKCFVSTEGVSAEAIIKHMADYQADYFDALEIDFSDLWGRPLQLIDCQNLFCEISKYSRVAFPDVRGKSGRSRIKQKFAPAGRLPAPFYPPEWGLNDKIANNASAN
ncbi:MAG: nucleotide kinase domain-containing protein [Pseudomonadota bacterium]